MKRSLWPFLLKLLLFTLLFGYIWFAALQVRYPDLIDPVARVFFKLTAVRRWWLALVVEHFTNLVPYLALVLSTPGLFRNWKRSLAALSGGLAALILVHLAMSAAVYHLELRYSLSREFYRIIVPIYVVNDALPLALWLLFYPHILSELFDLSRPGLRRRP